MKKTSIFFLLLLMPAFCLISSCSKDEEVRTPANILGIWTPNPDTYYEFGDDYTVHSLEIVYEGNESIGLWEKDLYFYEPGYNLVIYVAAEKREANVYEVVELTSSHFTWCWVDAIDTSGNESMGQIIGKIINRAQEGYTLNPELYENFNRISEDDFLNLLDSLDIEYPY